MRRRTSNARPGRRTSITTVLVGLGALILGAAPVATAAPADAALPVPVVGITTLPTGFPSLVYTQVTVRTDPERRGITEFVGYCSCTVHWRNMSTGVGGTMVPAVKPTPVVTGSGTLVAAMTVDGRSGVAVTALPGAGTWNVP
ncbi:hypothetical protein [Rhodococcus koreensis]|jgi:hypothetical protein|uniref:hypothetical protein n=1 Tax=Rhodococcus koreensis TaxID=99653 RepID=UPI00197ECBDB|nr:hypothetical protein [Rhodococcus koreensis]QSE81187.1 hypothetical protein JWS14_19585 [Rhodococcus koreensis]